MCLMKLENMSEFNFKSQICTTREQSERLLALGLKKETADCYLVVEKEEVTVVARPYYEIIEDLNDLPFDAEIIPAWSLHRLIEMTKLKVTPFLYGIEISHPLWERAFVKRANVWDNLCDCIEWLIKEGYFPKEYL